MNCFTNLFLFLGHKNKAFSDKSESGDERDDHFPKTGENGQPRQFSAEELAPQIMIRKAKKVSSKTIILILIISF